MKTTTVLLAAGKGTRMKSELPKVLHQVAGRSLLWHCLRAIEAYTDEPPVVIVGHRAEAVIEAAGENVQFAVQEEQLGTGHAVMQAEKMLKGKTDLVLVISADMPLFTAETLAGLVETHNENDGPLTMLTVISEDPRGFGRIVRNEGGLVTAIVEEADCTPEQKLIKELNAGAYCFRAEWLWENLTNIPISAKGEYYLTDMVGIANQAGESVKALTIEDTTEAMGINTRVHLAEAETIMRQRINTKWMLEGVTIIDPESTYIDAGAKIGVDTILHPNTYIQGDTVIGDNCLIGPNTLIRDSQVGNSCEILTSVLEYARIDDNVDIGPYGHLRKGAHLKDGVHMGNFGEVKNATLEKGSKMGHFSYIGDADIGKNVNIGAGTITANYDGKNKNHTEIGDDVFIGSDTMLVAPLKIGKGARTGAGSVVTKDVEEDTVVVGIPARAIRKNKKK